MGTEARFHEIEATFTYLNPKYFGLEEPVREVIGAYQNAARFFDTVQERVYIEAGMKNTALEIHKMAHEFPKRFDAFGDMLHERHLMAIYPPTPELTEDIKTVTRAFEILIEALDEIQEALEKFHHATETAKLRPMALKSEELMLQNSETYTQFLEMWKMWENQPDPATFDSWVKKTFCGEGD